MDLINTYKGSRKYIHGTTIFNSVYSLLKAEYESLSSHQFDLKLMAPALKPLSVIRNNEFVKNEVKARLIVTHEESSEVFYFVECDKEFEINRIDYDEELIIQNFYRTNNGIGIPYSNEYTLIEIIVSLNKKLMNMIYGNSSWYFVKLNLRAIPDSINHIELRNVGNKSVMTKTAIIINGLNLGTINFSKR